ncbi:MAG: hypothetical protein AB7E47_04640 [Desulfovibrionaceae bacterium]
MAGTRMTSGSCGNDDAARRVQEALRAIIAMLSGADCREVRTGRHRPSTEIMEL